jgi:hypothetical protein
VMVAYLGDLAHVPTRVPTKQEAWLHFFQKGATALIEADAKILAENDYSGINKPMALARMAADLVDTMFERMPKDDE